MKKIIPIIAIALLTMASCHRSKGVPEGTDSTSVNYTDSRKPYNPNDSFIVNYRQEINGYKVKAVVYLDEDNLLPAKLTFTKDGKSFTLQTTSIGDSLYNKGQLGIFGENKELMKKYRIKTIKADYQKNSTNSKKMPYYTPFFFKDMDFDGVDELVIVHYTMAVRYSNGLDVYRIVESTPFLINYQPYNSGDYGDFGMSDEIKIDCVQKTISCPYPEEERYPWGYVIYGISKKQKDTVVVNGKKHLFNHLEVIGEIKYR